ncbi:hypothetical protein [Oenococcus oeni]|uniref:hypothetical protein n=1 Tax=Oenococcus oeni TaxID=1247 RepID=UPI0010BB4DFF|nr:hypothetical protein [Oenococcus oeni]SYW13326.1 hypothetical protein OENI_1160004 [Oenococcus oeni]
MESKKSVDDVKNFSDVKNLKMWFRNQAKLISEQSNENYQLAISRFRDLKKTALEDEKKIKRVKNSENMFFLDEYQKYLTNAFKKGGKITRENLHEFTFDVENYAIQNL